MKSVEMTDEQYQQWSGTQQRRGSRFWALWWGAISLLVVLAAVSMAADHFAPGIFSGIFQRAGFVVKQLPATVAPIPTLAPVPALYVAPPAPAAPAVVITMVVPPPPTATPCAFGTFYNAQSGRNECAGPGSGGGASYGTPEPEQPAPPAPGEPGFVESFQPAPDNGAFVGCLAISCNPGAVPTPWPASSGPQPGDAGFVDSFR